jgi:thiamine transporter
MRDGRTRILVEIALAIALAAVLNMLKIYRMPQGGTVSLVMLPIIVVSLRRGLLVGLATGVLYGMVDFFIDAQPPVHWAQPFLDYPIAYAMVGLSGLLAPVWTRVRSSGSIAGTALTIGSAALIAGVGRYIMHTASGVLFFGAYAPAGQPVLVYSLIYNLYVPLSAVLAFVAALALMPTLERSVPSSVAA